MALGKIDHMAKWFHHSFPLPQRGLTPLRGAGDE